MRRRSYGQHCGLARALDVVGERWTLLVVRDLLLGPRRYGDLLESLDGITTNLLAKRLREMSKLGLVEKRPLRAPATGEVYALTDAGRALEPAVMELARWGGRLLQHPRRADRRDLGWALLSMKRRYRGGLDFIAEVSTSRRAFELVFGDRLGVEEKRSERAAVRRTVSDGDLGSVYASMLDVSLGAVRRQARASSIPAHPNRKRVRAVTFRNRFALTVRAKFRLRRIHDAQLLTELQRRAALEHVRRALEVGDVGGCG